MATVERFATLSEGEKQHIIDNHDAKNTKRATSTAVKCFKEYLNHKNVSDDFEDWNESQLDENIGSFYLEARSREGELYKKSTLISYRHGLQRHLESNRTVSKVDIIKGDAFAKSNRVFKAVGKELKRQGKAATDHHPPISDTDIVKAYDYLISRINEGSARHLQFKVCLDNCPPPQCTKLGFFPTSSNSSLSRYSLKGKKTSLVAQLYCIILKFPISRTCFH